MYNYIFQCSLCNILPDKVENMNYPKVALYSEQLIKYNIYFLQCFIDHGRSQFKSSILFLQLH